MTRRRPFLFFGPLSLFLFSACGGISRKDQKQLARLLYQEQYPGALHFVEEKKLTSYGSKNAVLYDLDKGSILHYSGEYETSDASFDAAELRIQELYTKSATRAAGTLLVNDNTTNYSGRPFEVALMHVFRALNYAYRGKTEEALVESRKVELYLDELAQEVGKSAEYKDDAFARYLDSLLYADYGQADDARISLEHSKAAYTWYSSDYRTPTPDFNLPESANVPHGEIVFIHYNGIAPEKVSKTTQIAWGRAIMVAQSNGEDPNQMEQFNNALRAGVAGNAITVAYPGYVPLPLPIASSEIWVDSAPPVRTEVMEDVAAIAIKDLRDHMDGVMTRAIARATIKYVLARTATAAVQRQYGANSPLTLLTNIGTNMLAAGTEEADTRSWTTLPSQIRMARLWIPPGRHTVTVYFKDARGRVVKSHSFGAIEVLKGKRTYLHYSTVGEP